MIVCAQQKISHPRSHADRLELVDVGSGLGLREQAMNVSSGEELRCSYFD